jgi:hypothetical protein
MPSFFIDLRSQATGETVLHERSKCRPDRFPPPRDAEYLGELLDEGQALSLARLVFPHVKACPCCTPAAQQPTAVQAALFGLA